MKAVVCLVVLAVQCFAAIAAQVQHTNDVFLQVQDSAPVLIPNEEVVVSGATQGNFSYFQFYITRMYQFNVRLSNDDFASDVDLYLLRGSKPFLNSYDVRKGSGIGGEMITLSTKTYPAIEDDTVYYVGAYCVGPANRCTFRLKLEVFSCPNNCTGRGVCNTQLRSCSCNKDFTKEDCSSSFKQLTMGQKLALSISDEFYFSVNLTDQVLAIYDKLHVDIESVGSTSPYFLIFLKNGRIPSKTDYDVKRVNSLKSKFTFEVCFYELQNTTLYGLIVNENLDPLDVSLDAYFVALCPDDCSGHGTCNPLTGKCTCDQWWIGNDCSLKDEGIWKFTTIGFFFAGFASGILLTAIIVVIVFVFKRIVDKRKESQKTNEALLAYTENLNSM